MDYKLAGLLTYPDFLSPSHPIKTKTVACGTKSILSGTSGSKFTAAETVADSHGIPSLVVKILKKSHEPIRLQKYRIYTVKKTINQFKVCSKTLFLHNAEIEITIYMSYDIKQKINTLSLELTNTITATTY